MTDRNIPDRSAVRELAKRLGQRPSPPVVLTGSSAPAGHANQTNITGLPMPIGDEGDVLTVVDVDGDIIPQWAPSTGDGASSLDDLTDVDAPLPMDGDILVWNATLLMWEASAPTAVGRYRFPMYSTYGGGDLIWDSDGHLMYALLELE